MDCCLWFDKHRISKAQEISEHFDLAALRGYFLGGHLSEWLREHGGAEYADKLDRLDRRCSDLNRRLAEIFGHTVSAVSIFTGNAAEERTHSPFECSGSAYYGSGSFAGYMYGSGRLAGSFGGSGWLRLGSFYGGTGSWLGSYAYGSGGLMGGSFRRFSLWEWEWEWRSLGSFRQTGSFLGSYTGLFSGSFMGFGSYIFGSAAYLIGSFRRTAGQGHSSFCGSGFMTPDEYDRIMFECLHRCPLDCFGYGIHII